MTTANWLDMSMSILGKVTAPDYVKGAQNYLRRNLVLPTGYSIEWTGVYKYAQEARARLPSWSQLRS